MREAPREAAAPLGRGPANTRAATQEAGSVALGAQLPFQSKRRAFSAASSNAILASNSAARCSAILSR